MQSFTTVYGLDAANVRTRTANCRRFRLKAQQKKKNELCIDLKKFNAVIHDLIYTIFIFTYKSTFRFIHQVA